MFFNSIVFIPVCSSGIGVIPVKKKNHFFSLGTFLDLGTVGVTSWNVVSSEGVETCGVYQKMLKNL